MKIGIIADSHGNLVALDAILADLDQVKPDRLIHLGDVAALGPEPARSIARVRDLDCPVVLGNTDAWLSDPARVPGTAERPPQLTDLLAWGTGQLSAADRAFLSGLPETVEIPLADNLALLCYHGSPRSYDDPIFATTPDDEVEQLLNGVNPTLLAGGHTHVAMLRRLGGRLMLNPGAVSGRVSLPGHQFFAGPVSTTPPWAEYAVVTWEQRRLSVDLRAVPLDLDAVAQSARASGMPHADWWIDGWR